MIYAAIFGALDVLIILNLATQRRFYIIERLFVIFVSIIGFGYFYEIFASQNQIRLPYYFIRLYRR